MKSEPFSEYYVKGLSKRVGRENKRTFLKKLDQIQSFVSEAYKFYRNKTENMIRQPLYENVCGALIIFSDVTEWLGDNLSLNRMRGQGKTSKLEEKWIPISKLIVRMLEDTELAYTTYESSLGMECDQSVSNLFLNIKDGSGKKPYFPDALCKAADILFKNDEFEFAQRYALMAAIDAIWDPYRYEKGDAIGALMQIPQNLEEQGMFDESSNYIMSMLEWLYEFYSTWGLQEAGDLYIMVLHYELINRWNKITDKMKRRVVKFWKVVTKVVVEVFRGWVVFDNYLMSNLIGVLIKSNLYEEAFEIVEARIAALASYGSSIVDSHRHAKLTINPLLQDLQGLTKLGFDLKDRKIVSLKKNLNLMKSKHLEDKTSKLAHCMGYSEKGNRVWRFEDQTLYKFISNKKTNTVEIDVHQHKVDYVRGKERKILFLAECKYRNRLATAKDLEFFIHKARDLLKHEKDFAKRYPEKLIPRINELWFISVNGFRQRALAYAHKIGGSRLKLLNITKLNEMLKRYNLREVPTV